MQKPNKKKRIINIEIDNLQRVLFSVIPFLVLFLLYISSSYSRLSKNPNDSILPSIPQMVESVKKIAFTKDKRKDKYIMLSDTLISLKRIGIGISVSAFFAFIIGILLGMIPYFNGIFLTLFTFISMIPPMAILPILFIIFGLEELSKVMLIIIGICPIMIRDIYQRTKELPKEQLLKVQTLGASTWQILVRIIAPQIFPHLIGAVRLTIGTAWIFLISAEAISATQGLGYRIFLVRRYLAMDIIIPYVIWITLIAYFFDLFLKTTLQKLFKWNTQLN